MYIYVHIYMYAYVYMYTYVCVFVHTYSIPQSQKRKAGNAKSQIEENIPLYQPAKEIKSEKEKRNVSRHQIYLLGLSKYRFAHFLENKRLSKSNSNCEIFLRILLKIT